METESSADKTALRIPTIPIDQLAHLRKIERMVRRFLHEALAVDPENLACDIWVDLWVRGQSVCWRHVRNRCIDVIRATVLHREVRLTDEVEAAPAPGRTEATTEVVTNAQERLDILFKCPWITPRDRKLLYWRYYAELTDASVAQLEGCSRETITKDIAKAAEKLRMWAFVCEQESGAKETDDGR